MRRAIVLCLCLLAPMAFAQLAIEPPKIVFHGEGILNRVDPGLGIVNISHGPVPAAGWAPMTRDLQLSPRKLAGGLRVGMRVRFRLAIEDPLNLHIVAIEPVKR